MRPCQVSRRRAAARRSVLVRDPGGPACHLGIRGAGLERGDV